MKDRINRLMKEERLTALRFAEILEVQPSSISHILSGRNKPSFDFIEKLLSKFPEINPDWLILGNGTMYRQEPNEEKAPAGNAEADLFGGFSGEVKQSNFQHENATTIITDVNSIDNDMVSNDVVTNVSSGKSIEKIIILYNDGTFSDYTK